MVFDYDLIVIGGGSGGLVASKLALGLGKSVAIVEKDRLGGECTNTGCVPSKALIKCGQVARDAQNLNKYGLSNQGAIALNTDKVMDHVRSIIQEVYQTHTPEKLRETGIGVIKGAARFIDRNTIEVGGKRVRAKKFIITTGSSPFVPSIDGLDTVDYLTNENLFELDTLPESIVIIGGGAIGAEMACALNNLGVKVTIVEMQDRMLVHEDEELVEILQAHLREQGITILTNTAVVQVAKDGERVVITCKDEKGNQDVLTEKVLVAVGRQPNLDGLNLDGIGVKTNKRGIETNNKLQTSVPNIYACGDVVGPYQFSHMAFYQAVIAGRNALFPFGPKLNYDNVIWCTFTGPELAHAGLTEQEARKKFGDSKLLGCANSA